MTSASTEGIGLGGAEKGDPGTVLLVEDDAGVRRALERMLQAEGYRTVAFGDGESCTAELRRLLPDVAILDLTLPGMGGLDVLEHCRVAHPDLPVVILTGTEDVDTVVTAVRLGAFEYMLKPPSRPRLLTTIRNAVAQRRATAKVRELELRLEGGAYPGILGTSQVMLALFAEMRRVAPTDVSVVIRGESGSGKELVARALHRTGGRASGPFVAINCAAVPESLQESELFGHERGAFTGATGRRIGLFEQAHGGTLFLDEVGELGPALQAKLLRVLQERVFTRVGSPTVIHSDFRLVSATNRDLRDDVLDGRFREDLYFRLAVFELVVPPLRDRGEDVLLLAHSFARDLGRQIGGVPCEITREAAAALGAHDWPGNVRELQNVIQRAAVLASDGRIDLRSLPTEIRTVRGSLARWQEPLPTSPSHPTGSTTEDVDERARAAREEGLWDHLLTGLTLDEIERRALDAALRRHEGNRSRAARELGIARATLYRKLERG